MTVAIVVGGLVVYHLLLGGGVPGERTASPLVEPGSGEAAAGLGGAESAARVAQLERRLSALEADLHALRQGREAALDADMARFRDLYQRMQKEEQVARSRVQVEATVRLYAKEASAEEVGRAGELLAAYYEDMRAAYARFPNMDPERRKQVQREVDGLQAQLRTDLRVILPDEAVERIVRTLPGGSRPMSSSDQGLKGTPGAVLEPK